MVGPSPFPILGIDSDNGSELINDYLLRWRTEQMITFTRSRPGNKNDGAHVEQKNWARVRELVGYYRYDTPAELTKPNQIWELDSLLTKLETLAQAKRAPRANPRSTPAGTTKAPRVATLVER